MTTRSKGRKNLEALGIISTGFTLAHGLLTFVAFTTLYDSIIYNYSNESLWYIIFYIAPLLVGISFYLILRGQIIHKAITTLFIVVFFFQTIFTCVAICYNKIYWGYPLKRPPLFPEMSDAQKLITFSTVSNHHRVDDSTYTIALDPLHLVGNEDEHVTYVRNNRDEWYYGGFDRVLMEFQDHASMWPDLYHIEETYKDPNARILVADVKSIEMQMEESDVLDRGDGTIGALALDGWIIEFLTTEKGTYVFVVIKGGQVENDHFPRYEFLFLRHEGELKLVKHLRYYVDNAGIEFIEYASMAPVFSLLIIVLSPFLFGAICLVQKLQMRSS